MNSCPCCSNQLLRHIRYQGIYWFCSSCWQEMPNLDSSLKNDESGLHPQFKLPDKNQFFSVTLSQQQLFRSTSSSALSLHNRRDKGELGTGKLKNLGRIPISFRGERGERFLEIRLARS